MMKIAPSLLAADFSRLGEEVKKVSSADLLHIDIMDGRFVPNLSMGPCVVSALRGKTDLIFDVHLMLEDPLPYIRIFREAGADRITFHAECAADPEKVISEIEACKAQAGMALKPGTPAEKLFPFAERLSQVTIMTVEPGFGGQKLMEKPLEKIKLLKEAFPHLSFEVDGGVCRETLSLCRSAGADILVAGTAVFRAEDPAREIAFFRE